VSNVCVCVSILWECVCVSLFWECGGVSILWECGCVSIFWECGCVSILWECADGASVSVQSSYRFGVLAEKRQLVLRAG